MVPALSVKNLVLLFVVLLCANALMYRAIATSSGVYLTVQKAGAGTVALLRAPGGERVLINVGPDAGILRVLGTTLAPWERSLSVVVLTDGTAIHAGGTSELLKRYRADTLLRFGTLGSARREAVIDQSVRRDAIREIAHLPYGRQLLIAGVALTIAGPDTLMITAKNKTLVVSSTTSVGTYRFLGD